MDQAEVLARSVPQLNTKVAIPAFHVIQPLTTANHARIVLDALYAKQHLLYTLEQTAAVEQQSICRAINAMLVQQVFPIVKHVQAQLYAPAARQVLFWQVRRTATVTQLPILIQQSTHAHCALQT